jgi:hypothetical protein
MVLVGVGMLPAFPYGSFFGAILIVLGIGMFFSGT